jgi:hypothetical protein
MLGKLIASTIFIADFLMARRAASVRRVLMFLPRVVHQRRIDTEREGVGFINKCEMRRSSAAENKHYAFFINTVGVCTPKR